MVGIGVGWGQWLGSEVGGYPMVGTGSGRVSMVGTGSGRVSNRQDRKSRAARERPPLQGFIGSAGTSHVCEGGAPYSLPFTLYSLRFTVPFTLVGLLRSRGVLRN